MSAARLPDRKLRVGVTLHLREGQQSIWENGIFQNCAFLVQLLNASPAVKRAVLVNGGDAQVVPDAMMLRDKELTVIGLAEALQSLDVVIEMSALLPEAWVSQFRAKGGRVAWMRVGNDYVIDIERSMFDKPSGSLVSAKKYDAVWTLPQYEGICGDYFGLTARAPVRFVPHLWTPYFLERGISGLPQDVRYGYRPGRSRWRVCCFEPNVCMVKIGFIPMLGVEEAYRARPAFLDSFRAMNMFQFKDHVQFVHFARSLDIFNHGVATVEGRFPTYDYMAKNGDCIISHQWENGQNYLYYEALYGGYPLVHNSPFIRDQGYFYPDFDCQEAGRALLKAFEAHDRELPAYKDKAGQLLRQLDTAHPGNVEIYTRELLALYGSA